MSTSSDKTTNKELKEALAFDPLAEAERLTGLSYKKNDAVTALGFGLMRKQREQTNALLFLNRDTNAFGQSLQEYLEIIADMGFQQILEDPVEGTDDTYRIFWREDGVLLNVEGYNGNRSVNSAAAYLNYAGPRDPLTCTNGLAAEVDGVDVWDCHLDAREGFRFSLAEMSAAGRILPAWIKRPFLWLLTYKESKVEGYDHEAITESRIARLPESVQKAITPQE